MAITGSNSRLVRTCRHVVVEQQEELSVSVPVPLAVARAPQSSFGRVVRGLDPAQLSSAGCELKVSLSGLLSQYKVVVLRLDRPLSVDEMKEVASLFGEVKAGMARCEDGTVRKYLSYDHFGSPRVLQGTGIMEHRSGFVLRPEILRKLVNALTSSGGDSLRPFVYEGFHTDDSYTSAPAGVTMLHARALPPSGGGDTLFLDMAGAFFQLAEVEPHTLAHLEGRCAEHAYNNKGAFPPRPATSGGNEALVKPRHPILRRHHITGVPSLYWDLDRATGAVDGLGWAEGQALLQRLQNKVEATAPRYRHVWQPHDVLVWDNASVQHAVVGDFPVGEARTMWRMLLEGEPPQSWAR